MGFSEFLQNRCGQAKALVSALKKHFQYVSILGEDVKDTHFQVDKNTSNISTGDDTSCGFVVKMSNGSVFFEYSLDDISGDVAALAEKISGIFELNETLLSHTINPVQLADEPLVQSFDQPDDLADYTDHQILEFLKGQQKDVQGMSDHILNAIAKIGIREVSKMFISTNRELKQHFSWTNGYLTAVYEENDKTVSAWECCYDSLISKVMEQMPARHEKLLKKCYNLTLAKAITPGVYDVITDISISGLIAHEAFGHGVEMDQFVKDRALAKQYVGDYVASPIVNMRDGASSCLSAGSYFFDDDGVLAHDTQIIKDGILVQGISDLASSAELGTEPTGNGRRESYRRKPYARMTNTFFELGHDKLEDMIASIKHGYMIFETNNGMEDPKNWAIQCVAEYGIEIIDCKLTDNYVSPVIMSGYVPDLLKSISMIADETEIEGVGQCGKGYKEWVRVSSGGPALKVRVKLG